MKGNAEHVLRDWALKVCRNRDLGPGDFALLLLLTRWADNETGELDPANATVAAQLGKSDAWVREGRKRLVAAGLLEILDDSGGYMQGTRVRIVDYDQRYEVAKTNSIRRVAQRRDDERRRARAAKGPRRTSTQSGTPADRAAQTVGSSSSAKAVPGRRASQSERGARSGTRTTTTSTEGKKKLRGKASTPTTTSVRKNSTPSAAARGSGKQPRLSRLEQIVLDIVSESPGLNFHEVRRRVSLNDDPRVQSKGVNEELMSDLLDRLAYQGVLDNPDQTDRFYPSEGAVPEHRAHPVRVLQHRNAGRQPRRAR